MPQPRMTALLPNHSIPQFHEQPHGAVSGDASRGPHAASNGINSSRT